MSKYSSEREEKLLEQLLERYQTLGLVVWGEIEGAPDTYAKVLVKSDGTVKVEGVTTISGDVNVSDRWARQLGQVDIARYLGSAVGLANPLHSQIVYGGVEIDPRDRNWNLGASDVPDLSDRAGRLLGKVYGNQDVLQQRATTKELYVQISHQGTEKDPTQIRALTSSDVVDVSDKAARLLGVVYGSQAQQLLQRATTYDLLVQLRHAGAEIDPRAIRALTSSDVVTVQGITDALPAGTNTIGYVKTLHDLKTYKTAVFDASASGNLVAAVADKVIKLHALTIQAQGTVVVNLNNGSGGASLMEWSFQAREGAVIPMANAPAYWAKTGVNTALYVTLSAAVVVTITAIYSDDDSS